VEVVVVLLTLEQLVHQMKEDFGTAKLKERMVVTIILVLRIPLEVEVVLQELVEMLFQEDKQDQEGRE
jgi:hypothetical protein